MAAIMNPANNTMPLFVRVPQSLHDYLDGIKSTTGISKQDAVTLFLHLASKLFDSETVVRMYDEYMLEGDVTKILFDSSSGHG